MDNNVGGSYIVKRAPRTTPAQLDYLAQYMAQHRRFATARFCGKFDKFDLEQQWEELTSQLNSLHGGVQKTVKQWQVVWRDLKSRTATRVIEMRGVREGDTPILLPIEQKVAGILGRERFVEEGPETTSWPEDADFVDPIVMTQNLQSEILLKDEALSPMPANTHFESEVEAVPVFSDPLDNVATVQRIKHDVESLADTKPVKRRKGVHARRKRLGMQLLRRARRDVSEMQKQNSESMHMLAEAVKLQAEATKIFAETEQRRISLEKDRLAANERHLSLLEKLIDEFRKKQ